MTFSPSRSNPSQRAGMRRGASGIGRALSRHRLGAGDGKGQNIRCAGDTGATRGMRIAARCDGDPQAKASPTISP